MTRIENFESMRLELQYKLDSAKTHSSRNKLGQFATPTALATDILEFAKSLVAPEVKIRFLDPAIGTGAFYSALLRSFPESQIASAVGYEIDANYASEAIKLWDDSRLALRFDDFTKAKPPSSEDAQANLIVCNPPYVRHHHIPADEKRRLHWLAKQVAGVSPNGLAGLYCYFLLLANAWMAEGGIAGWLIPSEFMDVNYGKTVKEYLLNRVTLLRIHRFDPNDVQFEDALVSSTVIWFKKVRPPKNHSVEFSYGGRLADPGIVQLISHDDLSHSSKWTQFPAKIHGTDLDKQEYLRLSDLFKIQRGVATGANEFFVLTSEQVTRYELPKIFLKPILPSPRFLGVDEIKADPNGEPSLDRKLFLLSCNLPETEIKTKYPSLWRYLQMGAKRGVNNRYLCKHRSPWYSQEYRRPAIFLCNYMGRQDNDRGRPFRFILNHSNATAPNVYLLLYPKPILEQELQGKPDLIRTVWQALNEIPSDALVHTGRVYGGGLHKMEPKELGNAPADRILATMPNLVLESVKQKRLLERESVYHSTGAPKERE